MKSHARKGVNLGGWLVIERWMTPSLFKGLTASNEFELCRSSQGRKRVEFHHATFVTKADLEWLKASGITLLRVPIGYWIFGQDKRYVGAIDRLDWLMDTTRSLGIDVLLDLHAAPEAQNRAEHSGSGNTLTDAHSGEWLDNLSAQRETIRVLQRIIGRYVDYSNLWGIELLNEPIVDRFGTKLTRFYREAYMAVCEVGRPGLRVVFSDGYAPLRMTGCLRAVEVDDFPAVLDTHVYQVFGNRDKRRSFNGHMRRLRLTKLLLRLLQTQQAVMVGEWSAMLPKSYGPESTNRYIARQIDVFRNCEAHVFWSYKTESGGRWNFRELPGYIATINNDECDI